MIERRGRPCFLLEAAEPIGVGREERRQDLDGDVAPEARVAGAKDLAHAAGADRRDDFKRAEAGTGGQGHICQCGSWSTKSCES